MNKPVNEISFWKERIENDAKDDIRKSVYQTTDADWDRFNEFHRAKIAELIGPEDKVLDAGCGYGRNSELFLPENYIGVDFSPEFIAKAKELYPEYRFVRADMAEMPMFEDLQFDWAICVSIKKMIVDNVSNDAWEAVLSELKRVSKNVLVLEYEADTSEIL